MPEFLLDSTKTHRPKAERWRIDGRYLTKAEIAAEIGVTPAAIGFRMAKLRGASGAITMDRLRAIGKQESA